MRVIMDSSYYEEDLKRDQALLANAKIDLQRYQKNPLGTMAIAFNFELSILKGIKKLNNSRKRSFT
ncbi:MAG: hypothetical protein QM652_12410 [Legionella sp.]|uniref:hypothetical protein n=1 Tax=Legionella sp. TaxID=459 RepID=UPI0039E515FB